MLMLEMLVVANICGNGSAAMYERSKAQNKVAYSKGLKTGHLSKEAFVCLWFI
jgi:hypothetical protein